MERRTFLRTVGATTTVASLSFAAGCSSSNGGDDTETSSTGGGSGDTTTTVDYPNDWTGDVQSIDDGEEREGPTPIEVEAFDFKADDAGNLVITGTAKNVTEKQAKQALVIHISVGEDSYQAGKMFDLGPGETASFEVPFPVTMEAFDAKGSLVIKFPK
ncbi:hypothetical protein [Haladaptatus sp. ZSTT2]|uniref:hypothetical protein n=1 Tax=Haladaptatus sp. ZSTT2 TaxID=3120515 RepID=UPI00300F5EFA